jgi:hypothetical protein
VHLRAQEQGGGAVRLIAWNRPGERTWGDYARRADAGHFAVNIHARDVRDLLPRLVKLGATAPPWHGGRVEPHFWNYSGSQAWDSMFQDPDGILLDVFTVIEGRVRTFPGAVGAVETVAVHTLDITRSRRFYEGIGYHAIVDADLEPPEFLGMTAGSRLLSVNMQMGDTRPGRIELAQEVRLDGWTGRSIGDRAVPPNTGILSVSWCVEDHAAGSSRVRALGAQPIADAVRVELPGVGDVYLATFLGPDGEALELFARVRE